MYPKNINTPLMEGPPISRIHILNLMIFLEIIKFIVIPWKLSVHGSTAIFFISIHLFIGRPPPNIWTSLPEFDNLSKTTHEISLELLEFTSWISWSFRKYMNIWILRNSHNSLKYHTLFPPPPPLLRKPPT